MRLRLYLVMMVIALVLTHSRMGNVAFFFSLLIAGIIGLLLSRRAPRSTVILLTSLIIIDMFIVGAWFGIDKVAQRLEQKKSGMKSVFPFCPIGRTIYGQVPVYIVFTPYFHIIGNNIRQVFLITRIMIT